ncbi:MAG: glycosyltransferase family 4 protein [Solirubrobacterales bacterium]
MPALADQRVLVLHNRYRQVGGEERFVAQLVDLLRRRAGSVELLERVSAETGAAAAARGLVRGGLDPDEVAAAVERSGATIVHAHNLHPTFGWRALAAAREAGAATVLHLHNYRLFCAIGIAYRDGHDCTECAPDRTARGVLHNCRGSLPESIAYAVGLRRAQPKLAASVDRFVAPVRQVADDLCALGLDVPVSVLPTWLPDVDFANESNAGGGEYALYVGRATAEKGLFVAVEAAAESGVPLRVAGNGPDIQRAIELANKLEAPVDFMGQIDGQAMVAARMGAAFCILPSLWREVLPFAALEALAAGLPLIVSERGGLPELTERPLVVPAGDAGALAATMASLYADRDARAQAGARSLARARELFSEDVFAGRLEELYAQASGVAASSVASAQSH